jgi:DNA-binding NarL/FixJ family response regulator
METETLTRSVFIVEDSPIVRRRLVAMLGETEGVSVVGEADTPTNAVEGILRTRPGWVLLDIQLIGGTGLDVLRRVRKQVPETTFVVLTNLSDLHYRRACIELGANHFFDKADVLAVRDIVAGTRQPVLRMQGGKP